MLHRGPADPAVTMARLFATPFFAHFVPRVLVHAGIVVKHCPLLAARVLDHVVEACGNASAFRHIISGATELSQEGFQEAFSRRAAVEPAGAAVLVETAHPYEVRPGYMGYAGGRGDEKMFGV